MPRKKQPSTGPATAKQILSFFDQEDFGKASFAFELVSDIMAQRTAEETAGSTAGGGVEGAKRPRAKRRKAGLPPATEGAAEATYGE